MQRLSDPSESAQLVIELRTGTVLVRGERAELPPREARLLAVLAESPGEAISPSELVKAVWPDIPDVAPQELYPIISRLRDFLGDRDLIRNRRQYGYYLDLEPHDVLVTDTLAQPLVIKLEGEADDPAPEGPVVAEGDVRDPRRPGITRHLTAALIVAAVIASAWTAGFAISSRRSSGFDTMPMPPRPERAAEEPVDETQKSAQERRIQPAREKKKEARAGSKDQRRGAPRQRVPGTPAIAAPAAPPAAPAPAPNAQQQPSGASGTRSNETQQKPETKPKPSYPPPPTISLFHLYDSKSGDHFMTTSSSLASQKEAAGYAKTYVGKVYGRSGDGLVGIALDSGSAYIFRSPSPKTDPGCSAAPLYRLSSNGESFYTSSSSAASQWEAAGFAKTHVGYIGGC